MINPISASYQRGVNDAATDARYAPPRLLADYYQNAKHSLNFRGREDRRLRARMLGYMRELRRLEPLASRKARGY